MLLIEMMVVVARRGCVVLSEGWFIEEGVLGDGVSY